MIVTEKRYQKKIVVKMLTAIFILTTSTTFSQLCTGSLGDPIVDINFGSGTARGPALGSAITAYTYSSSGQLGEGVYTLANTTSGLKGNAWHVTSDHTGNTNGYMMVVNCATLASEGVFYTYTVDGLCSGTTYEFSAWLMNIMNGTDQYHPNVTFRISTKAGVVLGSYSTGSLPNTSSGVWNQYGFFFTTGTETEVVITILNIAPSATPGNDVALDDIKFRPCGPSLKALIAGGTSQKDICQDNQSIEVFNSTLSGGYATPQYQWQLSTDSGSTWTDIAGATSTAFTRQPTTAGTFLYRLAVANGTNITSAGCRVVSNIITITVHANPAIVVSSNNPTCYNATLELIANSAETGATYSWLGPDGFSSSEKQPSITNITAINNGWYHVTVTTAAGCINRDSTRVSANGSPVADAGKDTTICYGSSVTLHATGSGTSFTWSPSSTLSDAAIASPVATPLDTTYYILTVSNDKCSITDTVAIFVWSKISANAGPDKYMIEGTSVQLTASANGENISYSWTPVYNISSISTLSPVVSPVADTTYTLQVRSNNGCGSATDNVAVRVYKSITIPNAFSPNNDGINDTWTIKQLSGYTDADISVFNRYGQLVFKSKGYLNAWDGRRNGQPLPVGTYYYLIDLKTTLPLRYSGWVAILR